MGEYKWKINHLIFGFCVGAIASYVLLSYVGGESAFILIIFNFLYISLIFPLNGKIAAKFSMLLIGNAIGLLWNFLFPLFAHAVAYHFGELFNVLYIILGPFLNLVWIVSFWSTSLTVLANSKNGRAGT